MSQNDLSAATNQEVQNFTLFQACEYMLFKSVRHRYTAIQMIQKQATSAHMDLIRETWDKCKGDLSAWESERMFTFMTDMGAFTDEELIKITRSSKVGHGLIAMNHLKHLGEPFLERFLDHKSPGMRVHAARLLIQMGWRDAKKIATLIDAAKSQEAQSLAELISKMGEPRAVGALVRMARRLGYDSSYGIGACQAIAVLVENCKDLDF